MSFVSFVSFSFIITPLGRDNFCVRHSSSKLGFAFTYRNYSTWMLPTISEIERIADLSSVNGSYSELSEQQRMQFSSSDFLSRLTIGPSSESMT